MRDLKRASSLKPDDAETWLLLGDAYRAGGARLEDPDEGGLENGLSGIGLHRDVVWGAGEQLLGAGRDAALRSFSRARKLAPKDYRAPLGLGRVYLSQRRWGKALKALNEADADVFHREPDVLVERALGLLAKGEAPLALHDYNDAIRLYQPRLDGHSAVDAKPQAARAYYGRARLNERFRGMDRALPDYRRACELGLSRACERAATVASPPAPAR